MNRAGGVFQRRAQFQSPPAEQRCAEHERRQGERLGETEFAQPRENDSHSSAVAAAASNATWLSAMISRLNQLVRQPRNARHAFSGWPRCSGAASSPMVSSANAARFKLGVAETIVAAKSMPAAACVN